MHVLFKHLRKAGNTEQRREYSHYLAQQMGPMIHALMLVGALSYLVAVIASTLVNHSSLPLWLRLVPLPPLLLVASSTRYVRQPRLLSSLTLLCIVLLEIGINLNGVDDVHRRSVVLPGLLLPVASSVIWLGRWDFLAAMLLCALGPLPMLLFGGTDNMQVLQYLVYMAIAIALSTVLRAFMARTLFEQFRLERQLREQVNTDGLTGLLVRNRFLELARLALGDIRLRQQPACVLYLDADHFKSLNDNYGHAAGDAALIALASVIRRQMRQGDLIGRIGGEEFAMLLPGLDLQQAGARAEQLRQSMHEILRPDGPLTVSIGVAECDHAGEVLETLLARADQAMRQAKRDGRDRVVSA